MSEETNRLIQQKLDTLRSETIEFAKAANDCSIIMSNHHSENIGEIAGILNHGTLIIDKIQHREYEVLIETYDKFKKKLLRCNCR